MSAMKRYTHCVYADALEDALGRISVIGDGVTQPARRIYGLAETAMEACELRAKLLRVMKTRLPLIAGDGRSRPDLDVDRFDPRDFVGSQNRHEHGGKRHELLLAKLIAMAESNARDLAW
jgi:hypothetical protein